MDLGQTGTAIKVGIGVTPTRHHEECRGPRKSLLQFELGGPGRSTMKLHSIRWDRRIVTGVSKNNGK